MSLVVVSSGDSVTSKTRALASAVLDIEESGRLIDLLALSADALLGRQQDDRLDEAMAAASEASILVLATPIYRATYNGTLKAFLDRFPADALASTAVVLVATAGSPAHFLSLDTGGRSAVASLGGWTVPSVVYATGADFNDGRPSEELIGGLRAALLEARVLADTLSPQAAAKA
jgi:FMN reductase